jgi:hypothetical protein
VQQAVAQFKFLGFRYMQKLVLILFVLGVSLTSASNFQCSSNQKPIQISFLQAQEIAQKIWKSECSNNIDSLSFANSNDLLIFWNIHEPFPSIGMGHFIWPPKSYRGIFSEGRFHRVIEYFKKQNVKIPIWLDRARYCPWETRDEFYKDFNSKKMKEFRNFLIDTKNFQAMYMIERLNEAYFKILNAVSKRKKEHVIKQFSKLSKTTQGIYILVDYLNFKHEGTNPKERYCNQGWGVLQVLEEMNDMQSDRFLEKEFARAAKFVLKRRITNSRIHDCSLNEQIWWDNWSKRLNTYYKDLPNKS